MDIYTSFALLTPSLGKNPCKLPEEPYKLKKLHSGVIDQWRFRNLSFRRSATIPARDRQTDRQWPTDGRTNMSTTTNTACIAML